MALPSMAFLANTALFAVIALVVVGTAAGMLITRNAIYAALLLVLNFATVALLYLILGAPFISLVQITVYAGSIMVLFLFVIMLLGAEKMEAGEPITGQRTIAIVLGVIFLVEIALFFLARPNLGAIVQFPIAGAGSPSSVGKLLYTSYALPFEITGFLLLVATVGAIVLTRGEIRGAPSKSSELNFTLRKRE
jgi:NADH-quinone oxidoreductase subunit J